MRKLLTVLIVLLSGSACKTAEPASARIKALEKAKAESFITSRPLDVDHKKAAISEYEKHHGGLTLPRSCLEDFLETNTSGVTCWHPWTPRVSIETAISGFGIDIPIDGEAAELSPLQSLIPLHIAGRFAQAQNVKWLGGERIDVWNFALQAGVGLTYSPSDADSDMVGGVVTFGAMVEDRLSLSIGVGYSWPLDKAVGTETFMIAFPIGLPLVSLGGI